MEQSLAIDLHCSKCGFISTVPYTKLYSIWRQAYERMPEERKKQRYVTAEIKCTCGHTEKFESPIFRYIFGVIFDEFFTAEQQK